MVRVSVPQLIDPNLFESDPFTLPPSTVAYPLPVWPWIAGGTNAWDPLVLDINWLPQETSIQEGIDFAVVYDVSAWLHVKVLISDLVPWSMQLIGEIADANTNPWFPATPNIWDVWIITTIAGTVGWVTVEIGDQLIYSTSWWFVAQTNITEATQAEMEAGTAVWFKFASPITTNPANYTNHSGTFTWGDRIRMWSNADNAVVGVIPQSIADLANEFVNITEAAFLALVSWSSLVKWKVYEVFSAGYTEFAYLRATSNNTYLNIGESWVAEIDVTWLVTYDITNVSLAKKIRLLTTGTSELLGEITNNQLWYGNKFYILQNTTTTVTSWLENHGIWMNVGTPFRLFNRNYDGSPILWAAIVVYENSNPLIEWVDYNVFSSWADTYIDPLISYPASFIDVEYSYIPNTKLQVQLASVYDAISLPAPSVLVWDYGHQRLLYAYSLNNDENDYIEVVKWPQYNNVNQTRVVSDIISDPAVRIANVEIPFQVSDDQFENEIVAQGKLVGGRLYRISSPTAIDFTDVRGIDTSNWFIENNSKGEPSWLCQLDTSIYLTAWILDISTARYASTITVISADPTIKIFGITGWFQWKTYKLQFEWSFGVHIFGKNKVDTIAWSIILMDEDYRYILADTYKTESLTLLYSTAWYYQEVGKVEENKSLIKKSKIYSSDFHLVATTDEFKVLSASIGTNAIVPSVWWEFWVLRSQTWGSALWRAWWNGQTWLAMCVNDSLPIVFMSNIRITNLATALQNFHTRSWFMDVITGNPSNAMYVRHDSTSANWLLVNTIPWPITSVSDSWIPVSAWVRYNIMVIATSTEVMYLIWQAWSSYNYAGSITANIPLTNFIYWQLIQKTVWNTARDIFTDYWQIYKYVNR